MDEFHLSPPLFARRGIPCNPRAHFQYTECWGQKWGQQNRRDPHEKDDHAMKFTRQTAGPAGQKTSEAKRLAAVTNGKKGGRPITSPRTLEKLRRKAEDEAMEIRRSSERTRQIVAWDAEHPGLEREDDERTEAVMRIYRETYSLGYEAAADTATSETERER